MLLRGVNAASLEWTSTGEGHILKTVEVAVKDWHANLIRLPLSQDRWFGKAPEQKDGGVGYRALVGQLVDFCSTHNAYIILDLHWSNAGEWGKNIGQHNLPDTNSIAFWKNTALVYKDNPAVLFDLYNEPANINWDQWFKGGLMTETIKQTNTTPNTNITLTYESVGMSALVNAIRSTGAKNVIVADGINWAYEVDGILERRQPRRIWLCQPRRIPYESGIMKGCRLSDPTGNGVVYAVHPYPHAYKGRGRETIAKWVARMEPFARKLPMIVSEFGSMESKWPFPKTWNYNDDKWNQGMIGVLETHRWNWAAWDFHTTAWPCLISDWNYTPTPHFGVWVKQALEKNLEQ